MQNPIKKLKTHTDNANKKSPESPLRPMESIPGGYFSALSEGYRKAAQIFCIVLVLFFLLTLLFNSKLLTYTNFNYLLRDLDAAADLASDNYNSISYTNDELRVTANYRGGIITASTTDMTIYTATGKKSLYLNESFVAPSVAVSKKYALVYDLGGNHFSVYNSFAKVFEKNFDYAISSACASDSGWFSVVSKDESHTAVVYVYDKNFNLRSTYSFGSRYVFHSAINARGDRIAVVTVESDGDRYRTVLAMWEPGKEEKRYEIAVGEALPCGIGFMENGALSVLCTDGISYYDENSGKCLNTYSFEGKKPGRFSMTKSGCALAIPENHAGIVDNLIFVFDKNGKMIYNTIVPGGMLDMAFSGNSLYINQSTSIKKINIKNGAQTVQKISESGTKLIVYNDGNLLLCCQTKAKYIKM